VKKNQVTILILVIIVIVGLIGASRLGLFSPQKNTPTQPTTESATKNSLQKQTVDEIGLSFQMPAGATFRKEIADNAGTIRTLGFYVEKGDKDNPSYMLYGVYQADKEATEQDLEMTKTGMDASTIKDITLAGYKGIEGLITGPKTRYITIILKDNRLFSVSTIPPTLENKTLTDQILATFEFK